MLLELYMDSWSQSLGVMAIPMPRFPTLVMLFVTCEPTKELGVPATVGARTLLRRSFSLFIALLRLQQMKMTTATTTVPQIAALAAIIILSIWVDAGVSVRISRHWPNGTVSGVTVLSSSDTTQTTNASCTGNYWWLLFYFSCSVHVSLTWVGTFLILNDLSLGASGGPSWKMLSQNSLYTTLNPRMLVESEPQWMSTVVSCRTASWTITSRSLLNARSLGSATVVRWSVSLV